MRAITAALRGRQGMADEAIADADRSLDLDRSNENIKAADAAAQGGAHAASAMWIAEQLHGPVWPVSTEDLESVGQSSAFVWLIPQLPHV